MIELRWVERLVYPEYKGPGSAALPKNERVLQYRHRQWPAINMGAAIISVTDPETGKSIPEWSDWIDVPTVREDG